MPRHFASTIASRALPPRAVVFCRAAMTVIATVLSIGVLVLLIGVVVALRTAQPGFGQEPANATEAPLPADLFFDIGQGDAAVEAPILRRRAAGQPGDRLSIRCGAPRRPVALPDFRGGYYRRLKLVVPAPPAQTELPGLATRPDVPV